LFYITMCYRIGLEELFVQRRDPLEMFVRGLDEVELAGIAGLSSASANSAAAA